MKRKPIFVLLVTLLFTFIFVSTGFSVHEEKGTVKGTVTEVKIVEVELTVKDAKGKVMKVKTTNTSYKLGDSVIVKGGKVSKEVKPITGGY